MNRPQYIRKPFDRLPLKQRAVFILHISGMSYRQIGYLLKIGCSSAHRICVKGKECYDLYSKAIRTAFCENR
jgi:DNA-directed RNA polymerase specialized sigma24 family protein